MDPMITISVLFSATALIILVQTVRKLIVPELTAALTGTFYPYGKPWIQKRAYLIPYALFNLVASVAGFFYMKMMFERNFQFHLMVPLGGLLAICGLGSILTLIAWVGAFFKRGSNGLFQDLYLTGAAIHDIARPFLWLLVTISVVLQLPAVILEAIVPNRSISYHSPLMWAGHLLSELTMMAFIFFLFANRMKALAVIGHIIVLLLGIALVPQLLAALGMTLVHRSLSYGFQEEANPITAASELITQCIFSYVYYSRFLKANPLKWTEGNR